MTHKTALSYLKKWFSNTSRNAVTLKEVYVASKRNLDEEESNKAWVRNKLTYMKRLGLVKPIYAKRENYEVLEQIQLTEQGIKALGTIRSVFHIVPSTYSAQAEANKNENSIALSDVVEVITELGKKVQNRSIILDFKLKEGIVSVRMIRDEV